jgi:hypothetical protein
VGVILTASSRPLYKRLDDDGQCLCGFFDFGKQELGELGCIDGDWSISYTFDVNGH